MFRLKDKNIYVQVFTSKWRKYPCLWHTFWSWFAAVGQRFFHLFIWSEQHDAMTQILTPEYTLQLYRFIIAVWMWCELRVKKKGIAIDYLVIPIYANCTNKQQEKKRSITMTLTLWLGRLLFYFLIFPGLPISLAGYDNNFFSTCPVGQVDEFSACPSVKTSCPCQILRINHFNKK